MSKEIKIITDSTNTKNYYNRDKHAKLKTIKRFSMFDGVGMDLTNTGSYDEALAGAGIDYSADKVPLFLENGTKVPNNFASVYSNDPNTVLGIVGNDYTPVSNRNAFAVAEEIVLEGYARYEVGGPCLGSKDKLDYSRSFLVLRGDDFQIEDDVYNSFTVFNNSFDGSTGVSYQVLCQRMICLNGVVRYLGGAENQIRINIQHSKSVMDKIRIAREAVLQRNQEIELIQKEAQTFMKINMTRKQFENEIIKKVVLPKKGFVEMKKDRQRGFDRIDKVVSDLLECYNADDVQNYTNSAYRVILALADYESHSEPFRNTGNKHLYLNRITQGMLLTSAIAKYIAEQNGIKVGKR